jgi:cell division protein YceG involved in septum cleavage
LNSAVTRISAAMFLLVLALGSVGAWQALRFVHTPASQDSTLVVFNVEKGQTLREIAIKLEKERLITDSKKISRLCAIQSTGQ